MTSVVYCLATPDAQCSYVGVTSDVAHRLRQHRGEIQGGAVATSRDGERIDWRLVCVLRGFLTRRHALQFEWRAHRGGLKRRRKFPMTHVPLPQRLLHLARTRTWDRVTTTAPAKSDYALRVEWQSQDYHTLYWTAQSTLH